MRIVRVTLILLSMMLLFNSREGITSDWNKTPGCVLEAAFLGLAGYLENIPLEEAVNYGFSSTEALKETLVRPLFGSPLLLRTISPNALGFYTKGMTVTDLISDMEVWYIPVIEGERIVAFVIVEQSDKFPCQMVSFGYAHLAANYEATIGRMGVNRRDSAVLIVVQQAREYFIAFPDDEPGNLYSLRAQVSQDTRGSKESEDSLSSVVKRLNPVIQANLQQSEEWQ